MWTLLEIHEVQFIVQLRSRLWSRNISGPIISSVELLRTTYKLSNVFASDPKYSDQLLSFSHNLYSSNEYVNYRAELFGLCFVAGEIRNRSVVKFNISCCRIEK